MSKNSNKERSNAGNGNSPKLTETLKLQCPKCGKKTGRTTRTGRVCINCGYKGELAEFMGAE